MLTNEKLHQALNTACQMAQELQDFVDAAEEAGDSLPSVRELIAQWEHEWQQLPEVLR